MDFQIDTMVIKLWNFIEFFGYEPAKGDTVMIDGFFWLITGYYGDDVVLEAAVVEELTA